MREVHHGKRTTASKTTPEKKTKQEMKCAHVSVPPVTSSWLDKDCLRNFIRYDALKLELCVSFL